jgi:hypothetical protein
MNEYTVLEINTSKVFTVDAISANKALNAAASMYRKLYGNYPSEKEFKLI